MAQDLTKVKFTPEELQECYIDRKMTQRQIARLFHTDVRKVRSAMQRWGIGIKRKENSHKKAEYIEQEFRDCYADKNMSLETIADHFNMGRGMVSYIAKKLKLPPKQKGRHLKQDSALSALKDLYRGYLQGALRRNLPFELTLEQFQGLTEQDCHYCSQAPTQKRRGYYYNGIDRIDSAKGYIPGNVRPCCGTCNFAKGKMTEQEFYEWIERIVAHMPINRATFASGSKVGRV